MRKKEIKKVDAIVTTSVVCDDCGEKCLNINCEIFAKCSFADKQEHIKDLCWNCFHNYQEETNKIKEDKKINKKDNHQS